MKIAILSCIHGNLEALETVVDDVRSRGIDKLVCLGDLVGYGPHPNEVVRFIERQNIKTILGCWDKGIGANDADCGCRYVSEEEGKLGALAFQWTRSTVTPENRRFLNGLPFSLRLELPFGVAIFVHGSPRSPNEYLTDTTHELILLERAASAGCQMLICGHTHVPFVKDVQGVLQITARDGIPQPLDRRERAQLLSPKRIVNAGSVGEPRHGGPESTYVTLDANTGEVEIRKVAYDLNKTIAAMEKAGIPETFVHRFRKAEELTGKDKHVPCDC